MRLLVKNGRIIDPSSRTDQIMDILIERGKILTLGYGIEPEDIPTIDASGLVVAPGFIDMHAHLREPGQEDKEDIASASRAAARGGFTTVCAMPNTRPVNDNPALTETILAEANRRAVVSVRPIAAITKGLAGNELTDMAGLLAAGAVAFSDDGRGVQDSRIMRRALETAKSLNALVIDHCEDEALSRGGVMNEGPVSERMGLPGIPAEAEEVMVSRDILLAEAVGARVHIAHVSTRGAVELVRQAKKRKVGVSAEVTPHHLVLTDAALESGDANFKVNPPLRARRDTEALFEALRDDVIDIFVTDHAPHTPEEKAAGLVRAPFGIDGLETAVSVLLNSLVVNKVISLSRLVEMLSTRPARLLGLRDKGRIAPGADADLTILNLRQDVEVDVGAFVSKSRNNPFLGWKLRGAPQMTIVGGQVVFPFRRFSGK